MKFRNNCAVSVELGSRFLHKIIGFCINIRIFLYKSGIRIQYFF